MDKALEKRDGRTCPPSRVYAAVAVLVGLLCAADIGYRHAYFASLAAHGWQPFLADLTVYIGSVAFEFCLFLLLVAAARKEPRAVYLFLLFYLVNLFSVYLFYSLFKTITGRNTYFYFFFAPQVFADNAILGLNYPATLLGLGGAAALWFPFRRSISRLPGLTKRAVLPVLLCAAALAPWLAVELMARDNRALPLANTVCSIINGYRDYLRRDSFGCELPARQPVLERRPVRERGRYNVLLIMNESLNPFYLKQHGYRLDTMPATSEFLEAHPRNCFVFDRAFANATTTYYSVAYALAGRNPVEDPSVLARQPLLFEALRGSLDNLRTGLISSGDYQEPNFRTFLESASPDWFYSRKTNGAGTVANDFTDDALIGSALEKFLGQVETGQVFCCVLHFSNTHIPYYSQGSAASVLSGRRLFDNYLKSLGNLDTNLSRIYGLLGERGLLENTVVVFTSDHSEAFGEKDGLYGHQGEYTMYNIRVPFWVYAPDSFLRERPEAAASLRANTGRNVSNNDIYATLLGVYGAGEGKGSAWGGSLLEPLDPDREIAVFNGLKGNNSDSRVYLALIGGEDFFQAARDGDRTGYERYGLRDPEQKKNLWGRDRLRDRRFLEFCRAHGF
jgi:glucan phosphoethanolaminetransferase (alkaline phosphatase superfamily)